MSVYKYLDLDSSWRDRVQYPNPSEYIVPVAYGPSQAQNAFQARSPISNAFPSVVSTTQAGSTTTQIILNDASSNIPDFYDGNYLQLGNEYQIITAYNALTQTATVMNAFTVAPVAGTTYYIRGAIPTLSSAIVAGSTQQVLNLGSAASSITGTYVGYYIYFTSGPNIGTSVLISVYNGSTQQATLAKALINIPGATDTYDILQFSGDSFSPVIYSGTSGFNQPVCYSVELLYLTMPNQILSSGYGGSLNFYPYLYVQLSNSGNLHEINTIYTNNPNAQVALFKVPLGLNLRSETFFCLKDAKMIQVCKFKPDQAMHFRVYLPNGEPIVWATPDNAPPLSVNPLLQISATFGLRRIDGSNDSGGRK